MGGAAEVKILHARVAEIVNDGPEAGAAVLFRRVELVRKDTTQPVAADHNTTQTTSMSVTGRSAQCVTASSASTAG